jgi:hypothetical protein
MAATLAAVLVAAGCAANASGSVEVASSTTSAAESAPSPDPTANGARIVWGESVRAGDLRITIQEPTAPVAADARRRGATTWTLTARVENTGKKDARPVKWAMKCSDPERTGDTWGDGSLSGRPVPGRSVIEGTVVLSSPVDLRAAATAEAPPCAAPVLLATALVGTNESLTFTAPLPP